MQQHFFLLSKWPDWLNSGRSFYTKTISIIHIFVSLITSVNDPWGDIYKPRGQLRVRGVSQLTILLHRPYLIKVTTKEVGGSQNNQKFDHVVYGWPLNSDLCKNCKIGKDGFASSKYFHICSKINYKLNHTFTSPYSVIFLLPFWDMAPILHNAQNLDYTINKIRLRMYVVFLFMYYKKAHQT